MKILVCVKRIVDIGLTRDGVGGPRSSIGGTPNPLDLSAIEEALRLRAATGGYVTAVTVGPPEADGVLRKALMMGADRALRLWDEKFGECDAAGMAQVLAALAEKLDFNLLLCGARSADSGSELLGAALAEYLGLPLVCGAISVRFDRGTNRIVADKKLEKGARETYAVAMPAVLTIERSTEPRYSSPNWVYRLRNERIEVLAASDVSIGDAPAEPRIRSIALVAPKPRAKIGVKVSGLSLKEKLAVMRGRASKQAHEPAIVGEPVDAARKIKEHLDRWLH